MKKLLLCIISLFLIGCTANKPADSSIKSSLYTLIPSTIGETLVYEDTNEYLFIEIHDVPKKEYLSYIGQCKESGFNNDVKENDTSFTAFNENGEMISLLYYDSEQYYSLEVTESKIHSSLNWKQTELLPDPECSEGKLERNDDKAISCYFHMNHDEFNAYVEKCKAYGFETSSQVNDDYFYADDQNGNDLYLRYIGAETVSLDLVIK